MLTFERFIVIRNPVSTHQERAERRIAELRALVPDAEVIVVETVPGGRRANRKVLQKYSDKFGPGTLLCIAAGDGTVNVVVEALLNMPGLSEQARRTPVLPLWCGNGNDLAGMLNGSARTSLRTVLAGGKVVAIRPLRITLTPPDGPANVRLAACYASFGASAFTAQALSSRIRARRALDAVPGARFLRELVTVSLVLMRAPLFGVGDAAGPRSVFEVVFLNGSRFAKVTGVPLKITDEAFHHTMVERKRALAVLREVARLTSRKHVGALRHTQAQFSVQEEAWAQFDGETLRLAPQTEVDIALAAQPFYAVTTSSKL